MNEQKSLALRMELLWWVFTAVVVFAVLFPIMSTVDNYPFLIPNIIFIIVFITFSRYFFLLQHTFLAYRQILKAIVFILCIPLISYIVNELTAVRSYLDEEGIDNLVKNLEYENHWNFTSYIKTQMYFFGAASIIVSILLPFRLLISIWRNRNRGTV